MSKYIELREAIERFLPMGTDIAKDQIVYMLNRVPAKNVVCCKDCHYNTDYLHPYYDDDAAVCYIWCEIFKRDPNNFCSFGKTDEE